ncbi:unnamed protein product [Lathyrus sativus]|nr:unnamed protein product [Lathyrus sativus]
MEQKQPLIIRDKNQMRNWSRSMRSQSKLIAFVPTMGYLHQGHLSLITEAHKYANVVAVSIYVNPGQFSPNEDLSTYPSDFEGDVQKLLSVPGGVEVVFNPKNLYDYGESEGGDGVVVVGGGEVVSCVEKSCLGHESWVRVEKLEKGLCGKSRSVFFSLEALLLLLLSCLILLSLMLLSLGKRIIINRELFREWFAILIFP